MADVAQSAGVKIVAVGHNSDDQAETVLLHFLRGSGLGGLRGMQALSPYPNVPELKLLRPLLYHSRTEIEDYCKKHNLNPLVDETNMRVRDELFEPVSKEKLVSALLAPCPEIAASSSATDFETDEPETDNDEADEYQDGIE